MNYIRKNLPPAFVERHFYANDGRNFVGNVSLNGRRVGGFETMLDIANLRVPDLM